MPSRLAVLTDFDGTITRTDVGEAILNEFAASEWGAVKALQGKRKVGTRESILRRLVVARQREEEAFAIAIRRAGPEMVRFVDRIAQLDDSFQEFVAFCRRSGLRLEVVSEGLDLYIGHLLRKWNLDLPVRTNQVNLDGGRVRIEYPWADATCILCRTCKLLRLFQLRTEGYRIAYVGDGPSDLCPAVEADLVFAKGELATLCEVEAIPYWPFDRFADVQQHLRGLP
jgi:2-hydroxy-3-keto-5-methylthiopentenyl-1-phosphate phosphatase